MISSSAKIKKVQGINNNSNNINEEEQKKTVKHFLRALNLHRGELRGWSEEKSMKEAIIYCTF